MDQPWWKAGVVYQVYPRSFQDTDGDGVGDLAGITRRLGYLQDLGVDAVWISPIFVSPMADFGYDVADYCAVDPLFGTLADFDALIAEAHARDLKLILDFVPNHTSDQHAWFKQSRASRTNPRRDWYIWRDAGPAGAPPNNWLSNFGGSAWEWDAATGQFYYHAFLKAQPDLNWRNPEVRAAMLDVLRFWMDRGVDGFRIDVLWHLIKDAQFRDNPPNLAFQPSQPGIERFLQLYSCDQAEVHEVVAQMRRVLDSYPDRVLIGEIYLPLERLVAYYGRDLAGAHLPFNFQLLQTAWRADAVDKVVRDYERLLPPGAWPNWVLGNHDRPRVASRVGEAQARVAAMLLFTLRGTPTLYYGDELGLKQAPIPPERVRDPWERNEPGLGLGRDPCRTPMPWDASSGAGFTAGEPWLPLNPDQATCNVAVQACDPASMLNLCRRLIALRRASAPLTGGDHTALSSDDGVLLFERHADAERMLIALNFTHEQRSVELPLGGWEPVCATTLAPRPPQGGRLELDADEGVILRPSSSPASGERAVVALASRDGNRVN